MHLQKGIMLVCCSVLVLGTIFFVSSNAAAEKFTLRPPIRINGDSGFVASNGVVAGNGSAANPYIIDGWEINGSGYGFGIYIGNTTDYFIVRNCYIHHAGGNSGEFTKNAGIYLYNVINGKIETNTVSSNGIGIYAVFSSGNAITGNTISQSTDAGVQLYLSDAFTVSNNSIVNNPYGLLLDSSIGCTLAGNTFSNDGVAIRGESIDYWNTHTIPTTNSVNGKSLYYFTNTNGITVPSAGQIILANCTGFSVKNLVITGTSTALVAGFTTSTKIENCNFSNNRFYGIELYACNANTINATNTSQNGISGVALTNSNWNRFNTVTAVSNQGTGILLMNSNNNTLSGIKASSNQNAGINLVQSYDNYILNSQVNQNGEDGIQCVYSHRNTISGCTANGNARYGIGLTNSDENSVAGCNASDCAAGIRLYRGNSNRISGNTAMNCNAGINLNYSCDTNQITGNNLINNNYGVFLLYSNSNNISSNTLSNNNIGVHVQSSSTNLITTNEFLANGVFGVNITTGSTSNRIHTNNFISNGLPSKQSADNGTSNYWNTSIAGNFWNDWTSPDANHDGIVDNPYTVNGTAGAKDFYPLVAKAPAIRITHAPVGIAYINQPIPVVAEIKSIYNISEAKVYYRPVGSSTWYALTMTRISGNATDGVYQATIPSQSITGTLDYYMTAIDEKNSIAQTPVYSVQVTSPVHEIASILIVLVCTFLILLPRKSKI
ncbi:MAG: right-handed parallel beta-helix repeat-containing protein [Thermoplasmata archaeon]|nr:right-handed parallel beta-helix repeat-containing protein [Thermoplasmata archaeon]